MPNRAPNQPSIFDHSEDVTLVNRVAYEPKRASIAPPVTAIPRAITVRLATNYGQKVIYPDCNDSRIFAKIAGTTTLTRANIALIRELGYQVRVAIPELDYSGE